MRLFIPLLCLSLSIISNLRAEGTREVAPNSSISINGNGTTDLAALHINHPAYNNFASYTNSDPHSRLYIHIKDPSKECVYLGFSFGHVNGNSPNPARLNYEYRVKDPAGNIVFGPVNMPTNGANIQNWSEGFTGPMQIHGPGGYNAHHVTSADLASQGWTGEGDYYVEFRSTAGADLLIDFWDITVAECSKLAAVEKKGRVWSYNWAIFAVNDFGFPNRPFNGAFYVCALDPDDIERAFITRIDFNGAGFRPAAFNIAFNSFGSQNTGNIEEDRKSQENVNSTESEYAIFLNDPVELCETAIVGEIVLLGISRCDAGDYCIKFSTTKEGQIDLLLDFDGQDDVYTPGTRDVLISHSVSADQVGLPSCVPWDGLDGFGNPMPEVAGTQIPIRISYAQGIYHFPIYDAEFMVTGFSLQAIRPASSIPLLYYDDSNISVPSGSGEPAVQLTGCNVPCHRWTNFVDNTVVGFGNVNTINSWWFSQRLVRQDVLLLPGYYTCQVDGPQSICEGSTTQITMVPQIQPSFVDELEVISTNWTGQGIIGSTSGNTITIGSAGTYTVEFSWLTGLGDTCSASCDYSLSTIPPVFETIDTLVVEGNVLVINGEQYSQPGQYVQNLTSAAGCDSVLTINVKVIQTVIYYDLNACEAFMSNGSHMDYSEFTAKQPQPLSCADLSATIVFREPASMQKHSCTPGVNNSIAMCISSLDTCGYDPGNDASLIFEITIAPDPDTAIHVTGFSFFEKAPLTYNWINGDSGPNNYPTLYGVRVLKNGVEIYRRENVATTTDWTEQLYDFLDEDEFIIEDPATFRFELLPYCLVGNGAVVAAWDIDDIRVMASCAPFEGLDQVISGIVKMPTGELVKNVEIRLVEKLIGTRNVSTHTNDVGFYVFEPVIEGSECQISAYDNKDAMNGVSTLDLVGIQKHLLGIKLFETPYQYVAADINKSSTVSARDIIDLRKLILGIYTEFPDNTSWRFGTSDEVLNGGYPWGFKETIDIERLQYDYPDADFTAVKIGDINGDVSIDAIGSEISSRSSDRFYLYYHDRPFKKGTQIKVDVYSRDAAELSGMQFGIVLDGFMIIDVISSSLNIEADNFVITNDELRLSWNHFEPVGIKSGEILFSFLLVHESNGLLSESLNFNEHILKAEAYTGAELNIDAISLSPFNEKVVHEGIQVMQNSPNPFSESTTLQFHLEKAGVVAIRLIDISGQVIKQFSREFSNGSHSFEIAGKDLANLKGVLFCRVESDGYTQTIKMVRL